MEQTGKVAVSLPGLFAIMKVVWLYGCMADYAVVAIQISKLEPQKNWCAKIAYC